MPYLTVQTNVADSQITNDFLKQLSAKVAEAVGKPEQYVVVHVSVQLQFNDRLFVLHMTERKKDSIGLSI